MNSTATSKKISRTLRHISHPARIRILLTIGEGEACVCHLEAALGYRQAYISQHLMALRKTGLLNSRREGRFIFYRLRDPKLLALIETAAALTDLSETEVHALTLSTMEIAGCGCPVCSPDPVTP
ncbi:MAG: metalloregulator ArsR/SmtB family transcription factor [Anaerolineales bacterium]